jgi:excisionase family DNA binding protein
MGHAAKGYEARRSELEPLLTIRDVAVLLSVTTRTVYRLLAAGEITASRVGDRLRFERREIRRYLSENREGPP